MDLLYSKYANPMDLMNSYINRGRFGEFVASVLEAEYQRRKEQVEKDDDMKLWIMYVHSSAEESFHDWKKRVLKSADNKKANRDHDLNDDSIKAIIDDLFV